MAASNPNTVLIHYGELALKGDNRRFFENALIESIKKHLRDLPYKTVRNLYGRILIETEVAPENRAEFARQLSHVFGIANFAFARKPLKKDIETLGQTAVSLLREYQHTVITRENPGGLSRVKEKTFKIETARSDKAFPLNSMEVSKQVGAEAVQQLGLKVDVKNPELTIYIEITHQGVFVMPEKIQGLGGLPTDTSGVMLGFLSGGIDSPVACFRLMKRGARVIFTHFHSYPQTNIESINKVKELTGLLNEYQLNSNLYLVPFLDIQKQILTNSRAELRVVLYRRLMMRIGNELARRESAQAIITGESLGQVASQTIENLSVIESAAKFPILRPLVGMDKEEIIKGAKQIGTFDVSIQPQDDCCQVFLPKHPATKSRIEEVESEEEKLEIKKLVKEAVEKSEVIKF